MSKSKNDIEQYKKYLSGELSNEEAHAFERSVLSDAFEQDALEGLESLPVNQAFSDIEKLQTKIKRHRKDISWIKLAAVVALLIASSLALWIVIKPMEKQQELAMETEKTTDNYESEPAKPSGIVDSLGTEESKIAEEKVNESFAPVDLYQSQNRQEEQSKNTPEVVAEVPQPEVIVSNEGADLAELMDAVEDEAEEIALEEILIADQVAQRKSSGLPIATSETRQDRKEKKRQEKARKKEEKRALSVDETGANLAQLTGKIVDESGEVLPGVTVTLKGTTIGTVTDTDGNFVIENNPNAVLSVSFIGFSTQEIRVGDKSQIDVTLNADTQALSEVVVTGYGERASEESVPSYAPARPLVGNKAFKDKIEKNLNYPADAISNNIEGTVTLQLTIDAVGNLSNIEVKKGLGYGCDEEAIRLVKENASWIPANKNGTNIEDKVRVKVKFKIP